MPKTHSPSWRMKKPCADCPFSDSAKGIHLRNSLHPSRIPEIEQVLLNDGHFTCHKTADETGDGSNRLCAGAIAFQEKHGVSSQYQRICERIEALSAGGA